MDAIVSNAEGRHVEALAEGTRAFEGRRHLGPSHQAVKTAFVAAVDAAFSIDRLDEAERLLATVEALPPGQIAPYMRAHGARFRSRLAPVRGGRDGVEPGLKSAEAIFREFKTPFWLAVTQLEHAEWLAAEGRSGEAEPLLLEARETFERLGAAPWLERANGLTLEAIEAA